MRILCSAVVVTGFAGNDGVGRVVRPRVSSSRASFDSDQLPVAYAVNANRISSHRSGSSRTSRTSRPFASMVRTLR